MTVDLRTSPSIRPCRSWVLVLTRAHQLDIPRTETKGFVDASGNQPTQDGTY